MSEPTDVKKLKTDHNILLGEGAYGKVYGTNHPNVACKQVYFKSELEGYPPFLLREISSSMALNHCSNIIKIINVRSDLKHINHVNIYMTRFASDLITHLDTYGDIYDIESIKLIMFQIIQGLYNAELLSICHRDVKLQNILINSENKIVIADWGLSRFMQTNDRTVFTNNVQTRWYRAPELMLGDTKYNTSIDVWSIGTLLYEMLTKTVMFPGSCEIEQLFRIFRQFGTPTPQTWAGIEKLPCYKHTFPQWKPKPLTPSIKGLDSQSCELIGKMLQLNPLDRINFRDSLNHSFFDSVRNNVFFPKQSLISNLNRLNKRVIDNTYMVRHTNINDILRNKLYNWLFSVSSGFGFKYQTFFIACEYFDLYLSNNICNNILHNLRLIGLTCLHIASKIHDTSSNRIDDYIKLTHNGYTSSDFLFMEESIVKSFEYNLYLTTPLTFLKILAKQLNLSNEIRNKITCLLYLINLDLNMKIINQPKLVAIAIMYYSRDSLSRFEFDKLLDVPQTPEESWNSLQKNLELIINKTYTKNINSIMKSIFENSKIKYYGYDKLDIFCQNHDTSEKISLIKELIM